MCVMLPAGQWQYKLFYKNLSTQKVNDQWNVPLFLEEKSWSLAEDTNQILFVRELYRGVTVGSLLRCSSKK